MELKLTWQEVGARVQLHAWGRNDGQGLYKAYLKGYTGQVLLGTLIPEGDYLTLRRTLSREELRRQGAWPIQGWEAVLSYSFHRPQPPEGWAWLDRPESLFGVGEPACYLSEDSQGLYRRTETGIQLAFPYRDDKPQALLPYICFFDEIKILEKPYLTISFIKSE